MGERTFLAVRLEDALEVLIINRIPFRPPLGTAPLGIATNDQKGMGFEEPAMGFFEDKHGFDQSRRLLEHDKELFAGLVDDVGGRANLNN